MAYRVASVEATLLEYLDKRQNAAASVATVHNTSAETKWQKCSKYRCYQRLT